MDPQLAELLSCLKRATNTQEAWRHTSEFLSKHSNGSDKHFVCAVNDLNEKPIVGDDHILPEPSSNPGKGGLDTRYIWLLVDLSQTNSIELELPPQSSPPDNQPASAVPIIGTGLMYAHARIQALTQNENALKTGITPRERETLLLLARGLRSDKIAYLMGIKPVTVNLHISNARRKLNASTREQALAIAICRGIITL